MRRCRAAAMRSLGVRWTGGDAGCVILARRTHPTGWTGSHWVAQPRCSHDNVVGRHDAMEGKVPMRSIIILSVLTAGLLPLVGAASPQVTQTTVVVTWDASGDDGLSGIANQYDLRYSTS